MELDQAVRGRRSIRVFLDKPVSKEAVARILEVSRWAPSGINLQPWRVTAVTGEKRDELEAKLVAQVESSGAGAGARYAENLPEPIAKRRDDLLAGITKVLGQAGVSIQKLLSGSYRFYGAPVVIVVSYESWMGDGGTAAVAPFVTTALLVAHDMGLGTCWLGMPLAYPDVIRETLKIPQSQQLAAFVALGYPDRNSPINKFRSSRDDVDEFVTWIGFD